MRVATIAVTCIAMMELAGADGDLTQGGAARGHRVVAAPPADDLDLLDARRRALGQRDEAAEAQVAPVFVVLVGPGVGGQAGDLGRDAERHGRVQVAVTHERVVAGEPGAVAGVAPQAERAAMGGPLERDVVLRHHLGGGEVDAPQPRTEFAASDVLELVGQQVAVVLEEPLVQAQRATRRRVPASRSRR